MLTDSRRRADFPSLTGRVYLNTAAESIPPVCTGEALQQYWKDKLMGMAGRDPHFATTEACRAVSARFLGLSPAEIAFCSCSSEAYNLLASALQLREQDEVIVSDLDFPAGVSPWLRSPQKPVVKLWQQSRGELCLADLEPLLSERTRLVQVSLVSFYNGYLIPWQALVERVRLLAPQAILSVDVTQALGRLPLDLAGADIIISSTHKWSLGIHGGCIIGIPAQSAERLTTHAGGWLHLQNAFEPDRFQRAEPRPGAASYAVGMPNFAALYALNASLRYLESVGVPAIAAQADPLVQRLHAALPSLGISPLSPQCLSGIVSFLHPRATELHQALVEKDIHVMHHAGRIRISVHGYNTAEDLDQLLAGMQNFAL